MEGREGDESVLVEVVDDIKNRADDSDGVVLTKLVLCEDVVKELSSGGEFKGEIEFCARLEVLVRLDCLVRLSWASREKDRRCWGGRSKSICWLNSCHHLIQVETGQC